MDASRLITAVPARGS